MVLYVSCAGARRYGLASEGLATEALDELVLAIQASANGQIGVHAFLAELRARGAGSENRNHALCALFRAPLRIPYTTQIVEWSQLGCACLLSNHAWLRIWCETHRHGARNGEDPQAHQATAREKGAADAEAGTDLS